MRIFKAFKQTRWAILGAGFFIIAAFALLYIYRPPYLKMMELKLYDAFLQQVHTRPENPSVVVVDIDEYSIKTFGQWPWPRYRVGLLLKKIQMGGAFAVGSDILFGEPDGTSPKVIREMLKRDLKVDLGFTGLPEQLWDNDRVLADILATGPFALGFSFYFKGTGGGDNPKSLLPFFKSAVVKEQGAGDPVQYLVRAEQAVPPLPLLMASARRAGYMNTFTDMDGVLRRVPLIMAWKGQIYPHLALATLMTGLEGKIPDPVIKVSPGGISSIRIGSTTIPLEANGAIMINYKGPAKTFDFIPAAHILEDRVEKNRLENKVVFLGSSAAGLMDIRVSPLAEVYPGVEVNATIVENILKKDFIFRPDWAPGLELAAICLWGIITAFLIGLAGAWLTLPITLVLGGGVYAGGLWALKAYHIWLSPLFPLLVLAANFSCLTLFKFWFSEKRKKFYRSAFSKYVSKAVVDQISESPDKMSLKGEEKEVSILFADIRSFTSLSERLSPTQVTNLLHDYFTPVTRHIIKNKGTLDKFIGDAVMCFWNAPLDVENHPALAVQTGFDILASLKELNLVFADKYKIQIDIGIGVHSGRCHVGNMGSVDLFDYTIIGDNVNLASRLESLTKFYGVKFIVSDQVKAQLELVYVFQELDQVRVKGKTAPVGVYTLFSAELGDSKAQELSTYEQALGLYKEKSFDRGLSVFSDLVNQFPKTKIYQVYKERCAYFISHPPEPDWDGVFVHKTK
ncbi:MAG: adenylate/guanylate cyclase domain-containing protein [Desulfobacter sp.]|nr:MAG: adenylate/guanylate cyclase domain-containing protein [Desulfobacter sp.]